MGYFAFDDLYLLSQCVEQNLVLPIKFVMAFVDLGFEGVVLVAEFVPSQHKNVDGFEVGVALKQRQ